MDEIFTRHMPEANGKYIVFCANAEHMREMIGKAPAWFGKLDKELHTCSPDVSFGTKSDRPWKAQRANMQSTQRICGSGENSATALPKEVV